MLKLFVDSPRYVVYDRRLWYFANYLTIFIHFFSFSLTSFVIQLNITIYTSHSLCSNCLWIITYNCYQSSNMKLESGPGTYICAMY